MNNTAEFELQPQFPVDKQLISLISDCSDGDEGALAELYGLTCGNLFALQVRILGRNTTTERALHDTYLRIWSQSSEYSDAACTPMSWLTSIARSHALQVKRARRANKDADPSMDDTVELVPAEYADTNFLANSPATQPLRKCFEELDVNVRDGIIRAYLDGWSLEELSEAYNKPVASLRSAIHAAMLSLGGHY